MPSTLITGANRGLGLEFARQYLADGWHVYAACRDPDSASELRRLADASDEKLALALGRPAQEIEAWTTGAGHIDGDVILKARHLALQRGIHIA